MPGTKPLTPAPATPASASVDAGTTVQVVELDIPDARFGSTVDFESKGSQDRDEVGKC